MQDDTRTLIVEHERAKAVVSFVAEVTQSSIIELVRTVNELRNQRFYDHVELQIASPGGEVLALEYFIDALSHWRDAGLDLTTRALTSCASAAAVMLSLGNVRKATPASSLVYHFARVHVSGQQAITRARARSYADSLKSIDERILGVLANRAACNDFEVRHFTREDLTNLTEIRESLQRDRDETDPGSWLRGWVEATRAASPSERVQRWHGLYRVLCDSDRDISGRLAHAFGLVDELVGPMPDFRDQATPPGHIRIPQWKRAYRNGDVDAKHLKRHTLVMGETGSGKTVSAILPIIAASYDSSDVGVALVIDPKFELGTNMEHLAEKRAGAKQSGKHLIRIDPEKIKLNIMDSEAWSVTKMIEERRYWTAAERVLQRVAGFTASNPAQMLLGKPPLGKDPYWEREGLLFATAVIAIAIEWSAEWLSVAHMIRDKLAKCAEPHESSAWVGIQKCFLKIHPDAFSLQQKWKDRIDKLRDDYARNFGELAPHQSDDDDIVQPSLPCAELGIEEEIDHRRVWYETDVDQFLAQIDDRSAYEDSALRRLLEMAETDREQENVEHLIRNYQNQVNEERQSLRTSRKASQLKAIEGLSDDDVMTGAIQVVHDMPRKGIAGRTWEEWESALAEALESRTREIRERSKEEKAEVERKSRDSSAYDHDDYMHDMGFIDHCRELELEQALPSLIIEELRATNGKEWESLVAEAKRVSTRGMGISSTLRARTIFLQALDVFEGLMMTTGFGDVMTGVDDDGDAMMSPNVIGVAGRILEDLFSLTAAGPSEIVRTMQERGGEFEKIVSTINRFVEMRDMDLKGQYTGCHGAAASVMFEFSRPGIERVLYFGCERPVMAHARRQRKKPSDAEHETPPESGFLDFRNDVRNSEPSPGVMYLYQPSRHRHDELVAKACKTLFFEAVLDSPERRKDGETMPMAAYIADEFQRFITADPIHGEQSFLDVCRAFGAFAVLACQSIASLRYALCELETDPEKRNSAIDIICNNTGTKMFFRSTDVETVRRISSISPLLSNGPSLIASRPLSSLRPGECYASFPDGRFERVQIDEYPMDARG